MYQRDFRPDRQPSPVQYFFLYLFRGSRDDHRGLIGLLLILGALILAIAFHRPFFEILALGLTVLGVLLLSRNFRNSRERDRIEREQHQ